jgi:hypothetical protein
MLMAAGRANVLPAIVVKHFKQIAVFHWKLCDDNGDNDDIEQVEWRATSCAIRRLGGQPF